MVRAPLSGALSLLALLACAGASRSEDRPMVVQESAARVTSMETLWPERAGRGVGARDLIELARIAGSRDALTVSPDGRHLLCQIQQASLAEDRIARSWALLDLAAPDAPPRIIDGGDPAPDILEDGRRSGSFLEPRALFSPDGARIAFVAARDGRQELRVARLDDMNVETILANADEIADVRWTPEAGLTFTRAHAAAPEANETEEGFLFDARFAPSVSMLPQRASLDRPALERFSWNVEDGLRQLSQQPALAQLAASNQRLATDGPGGARAWAEPASANATGYFAPLRPFVSQSGNGTGQACQASACVGAIEHLFWSRDGGELYLLMRDTNDPARRKLVAWAIPSGAVREIFATNDMLLGCRDTMRGIACIHEAPQQPRRIVQIGENASALTPLYEPNPRFSGIGFGRIDRLHALDAFGNRSFAHLVYPPDYARGRRYPLVIVQYRWRGFLNGGVGGEYPVPRFAEAGALVLEIDRPEDRRRGAELSGDQLQALYTENAYARAMSNSALGAYVDFLVARGLVDSERIGLTGLSDGADSVFYALSHGRRARAAIVSTPPSDPYDYFLASDSNRANLRRLGVGDPFSSDDAYWRAVAPFYHTSRLGAPLLMHLAQDEALRAMPFLTRMHDSGHPVEAYIFAGEHHIKTGPRHLLAIHERNLAWMDFWLRGRENGLAPNVRARWRAMRADHARAFSSSGASSGEAPAAQSPR
jgi:dienelactone hydrolase